MKKLSLILGLIIGITTYTLMVSNVMSQSVKVESSFSMDIPCSQLGNENYKFSLDFFENTQDPGGLYWQLDFLSVEVATQTEDCVQIDSTDLSIYIGSAELQGMHYEFNLQPYINPNDTANLFWQLDMTTLIARSGSQLFIDNCGSCHTANGLGSGNIGDRTGRTTSQIKAAIASIPAMSGLSSLSDPEIMAISDAITP